MKSQDQIMKKNPEKNSNFHNIFAQLLDLEHLVSESYELLEKILIFTQKLANEDRLFVNSLKKNPKKSSKKTHQKKEASKNSRG